MNRLFVTRLKSIGLVTAGDNPESEVVIFKSHTDTDPKAKAVIVRWDETVAEWSARNKRRLAAASDVLADLNKKIENVQSERLATIPDERNRMTDTEPQDIDQLVKAKLDVFARHQQFEGEMRGAHGHESTPREVMVQKIKARWWDTPDGLAVKDLLRERTRERSGPASLVEIAKSHSEAFAAIGRLDA